MAIGADDGQILQTSQNLAVGVGQRTKMMHLAELSTEFAVEFSEIKATDGAGKLPYGGKHLSAFGGNDCAVSLAA